MRLKIKRVKNIVSLDLSGLTGRYVPVFIVCNADSTTQVGAIAAGIEEKVLEVLGEKVRRIEGQQNAVWIAMGTMWTWSCTFPRPNCAGFTGSKSCGLMRR